MENVEHLHSSTSDKFNVVTEELRALHDIQVQIREIQNENWKLIFSKWKLCVMTSV